MNPAPTEEVQAIGGEVNSDLKLEACELKLQMCEMKAHLGQVITKIMEPKDEINIMKRLLMQRIIHACLVVRLFKLAMSLVSIMLSEPSSKCNLGTYYLNPCLNVVDMH
jgi:hypothetical protein